MPIRRVKRYAWKRIVDGFGRERGVWYDPSARGCWVSVEMVDGRVPDFSEPSTWADLRRRIRGRRRDRAEDGHRTG